MGMRRLQSCITLCTTFIWIISIGPTLSIIPTIGEVLPRDPKVWVGDTLTLTCILTNDMFVQNWTSLYFHRGNSEIPERSYVTKKSSRAIELKLPDVHIKDEETYYCRLNHSAKHPFVGYQWAFVYHKPVPVEKVDCVVHDWTWMRCTWDLGVKYHHPEVVSVSLVWVIDGPGNSQSDCPKKHFTNRSCEWREHDGRDSFRPDQIYTMAVIVRNTVKDQSSDPKIIKVHTKNKVKPARVDNLTADTVNSSCMALAWENRKKYRLKTCEIHLQSKWDEKKLWDQQTVCDLHPSVKYDIRVRCRPLIEGFFSDASHTTVIMPEDVPSRAPEFTAGSYEEIPGLQDHCREVTVYWKPIPEIYRNGLIIAYQLLVNGQVKKFTDVKSNQGTIQLNCNQDYQITVGAFTKQGPSVQSSPLLIKATGKKPSQPEDFYVKADSIDKNKVYLFWDKPETGFESVTNYTIYYCQAWKPQKRCRGSSAIEDGDLQWIHLSATQRKYSLVLPTVSDDYMFGLSADTPHFSSGLVWSTCTYLHNDVPRYPPENFRFAEVTSDLSLTVQWKNYDCEASGPVLYYILSYCLLTEANGDRKCESPTKKREIKASKSSYTIGDLQDQKEYSISLQAITEGGAGPASPWINGTAVKIGLSNGSIAGIAVAAFIMLCFAVFGVVVCGRRVKRDLMDFPEESIIIPPPLPDTDRFDSYTDIPVSDYHTVGSLPAASPTSRTSLLSNSTVASNNGSDSAGLTDDSGQVFFLQRSTCSNGHIPNGSVKSVDKLGKSSDKRKKKHKKIILPEGYFRFGVKKGSKSSGSLDLNGSAKTLPSKLSQEDNTDKDTVAMFTLGGGSLKVPGQHVICTNSQVQKQFLEVPPSQYQQNVVQHAAGTGGSEPDSGSSGNSQTPSSKPVTPYIRMGEVPNNCVGSAVSLASSGGLRQHTPPPEYCSSTDRDLSDCGGYEEPVRGPLSASTPIATGPHLRCLKKSACDSEDSLDQSYVERPKLTLDSRSLPSILECGNLQRRHSLEDSEDEDSTLSLGTDSISGEGVVGIELPVTGADHMCMFKSTDTDNNGYVPHDGNGADTDSNGYVPHDGNGADTDSNGYVPHDGNGAAATTNGYIPVPLTSPSPSPSCPSSTPPSPPSQLAIVDSYVRIPDMTRDQSTDTCENSHIPGINSNHRADYSKVSSSSVSRPISNYMRDLPAQYFLDPQALDDLPTTEL